MSENRRGEVHPTLQGRLSSSNLSYEVSALGCLNCSFTSFGFISPFLLMWKNGKGWANDIQIRLWNTEAHPFRKLTPQPYYDWLQTGLCFVSPTNSLWTGELGIRGLDNSRPTLCDPVSKTCMNHTIYKNTHESHLNPNYYLPVSRGQRLEYDNLAGQLLYI